MDSHNTHLRAIRPPPGARRNLFNQSTRRQNSTTIRPDRDMATIFQQPQEDELVERDSQGEYVLYAPTGYKHMAMALGREGDEEDEQEEQIISLYGKQNPTWDAAAFEEEMKAALKNNLRKKVVSLEEDKWIFQAESEGGKN